MKTIFIVLLAFLYLHSCLPDSTPATTPEPSFDASTLYPLPDLVNQYHNDWSRAHYKERIAVFKANPLQFGDIVFVGNSITELVNVNGNEGNWNSRFGNSKVKNRGIAGDVSTGVLNRVKEISYYKASKVFLKIGINDLFRNDLTPENVANNIKLIVEAIHKNSPKTIIYVQTILPSRDNSPPKEKIIATNVILKAMTPSDNLKIIDLFAVFADSNNLMKAGLTVDNLHLNETGYDLWEDSIREFVNN